MGQSNRKRSRPRVAEELEARWLLAAPQVPGNAGQVLSSQFQPFEFKTTVGTQVRDVRLSGPLKIDVVNPFPAGNSRASNSAPVINAGLIAGSQFNGGGFRTVGLQLDRVRLGRGLMVHGFDNEDPGANPNAGTLPALENTNSIVNSQFSDGGFGVLEFTIKDNKKNVVAREGRVGLQWRKTAVKGPVDIGVADLVIQPGADTAASAGPSAVPASSSPGKTVLDLITNIGQIRDSQFNDGGFGDIGMQWLGVGVGGRVGTSTNTLFIKPQQDNYGPITINNLSFGQSMAPTATAPADPAAPRTSRAARSATAAGPPFLTTFTNSATNSGRIIRAQINDGGFGDDGLQWKNVRVGGSVTVVHNSLTVQPQNVGQGLITVHGIQFPNAPGAAAHSPRERTRVLPPDPPAVASDGNPVALPAPTGPLSPFFPTPFGGRGTLTLPYPGNYPLVNAATNSGLILGGQFNAGGFGDLGLQWKDVRVAGNVRLVHNSLSVHPEGKKLAGISVSDVSYGPPVSPGLARLLKVLPYAVISPGTPAAGANANGGRVLSPPNDRWLTNQQLASSGGSDVFLQWNGVEHHRGLVLVHNIILIKGVGPTTGPIILSNIRFPFRVPTLAPLVHVVAPPGVAAPAHRAAASASASAEPARGLLLNSANNSGILSHTQFSAGGFGDIGLQWRNVAVTGSVSVVHNTLAVDESSDLTAGDVPGPITVSNVTFNSGALNGPLSPRHDQVIVSPPDLFRRVSSHPVNFGRPLPQDAAVQNEAVNSGIMMRGQLASGAANHALLQWQCAKVGGKVVVVDNILSISVQDRPTGPITISNVTFA